MKKSLWSALFLSFLLTTPVAFAAEEPLPQDAPLSPEYLQWVQERDALKKGALLEAEEDYPSGVVPSPIDRSHLASNPPRASTPEDAENVRAEAPPPASYDLRAWNWLPPVRNQNPFGTCWAHAAIGSAESNAIRKGFAGVDDINLSEMFLAYFVYGDSRPGKSFRLNANKGILDQGGNSDESIAFMSRQGNIDEVDLPYPTSGSYSAPLGFPENYVPSFQLRDAYQFGHANEANRDLIKRMIMEHGAVETYYRHDGSSYYSYRPDNDPTAFTTAFFNNNGTPINHAVLLVGWDDNFLRSNFGASEDKWPVNNGAWLVRNSWGRGWGMRGYFWMSYEQYTTNGTVYIVEPADNSLRHYGYDDLGHSGTTSQAWAANVFKAQEGESVQEIAFYTTDNNAAYEAYVYDLGTKAPSSPVEGALLTQWSGSVPYAGYHRVALPAPVDVGVKHWFSIVVKMTTPNHNYPTATEASWGNAVINPGESWFSSNGTSWTDGGTYKNATIKAFTSAQTLSIHTASLPDGTVDKAYSAQLVAKGVKPITWTKASGTLPPGLVLSADGKITGTPTKAGTYGFTVKATNARKSVTKALKIIVGEQPTITTTTDNLPGAVVNTNYSFTLAASGTKTITWSSTNLPAWLTLAANGRLSGKPTSQGTYYFTVTAKNDFGQASQSLRLTVGTKPVITTATLQSGVVNTYYSTTLAATGTASITWTKASGALPPGLTLATNGRITGTPEKLGTYSFTVKAENKMGSVTKALKIVIGERPAITTTTVNLPGAVVNTNYSATLAATGTKTITWSSTNLPDWLSLTPAGKLSGKAPETEGTHTFTVTAKNDFGQVSQSLRLTVGAKPAITTATLQGGVMNTYYSASLAATGTATITWTKASGTLPPGLTLATNGRITGTPEKLGTYSFTVKAENKMGSVTKALKIVIGERPAITTTTDNLPGAVVDTNYNFTLAATGTKPMTWSHTSGTLPPGIALASNGRLSGKPSAQGAYTFYVKAKSDFGEFSQRLTLTVGTKPVITTATLPDGVVNKPYTNTTLAATGTKPIKWEMKPTSGLVLSEAGVLSGTPTKAGTLSLSVKATNKMGSVTKTFKVVVAKQ